MLRIYKDDEDIEQSLHFFALVLWISWSVPKISDRIGLEVIRWGIEFGVETGRDWLQQLHVPVMSEYVRPPDVYLADGSCTNWQVLTLISLASISLWCRPWFSPQRVEMPWGLSTPVHTTRKGAAGLHPFESGWITDRSPHTGRWIRQVWPYDFEIRWCLKLFYVKRSTGSGMNFNPWASTCMNYLNISEL